MNSEIMKLIKKIIDTNSNAVFMVFPTVSLIILCNTDDLFDSNN
jgi:hypothetical protein